MSTLNWRITPDIAHRFNQLCHQLQLCENHHSTEYADLVSEIRRLPKFPTGWDEQNDTITVEITGPKSMIEMPKQWKPSPR